MKLIKERLEFDLKQATEDLQSRLYIEKKKNENAMDEIEQLKELLKRPTGREDNLMQTYLRENTTLKTELEKSQERARELSELLEERTRELLDYGNMKQQLIEIQYQLKMADKKLADAAKERELYVAKVETEKETTLAHIKASTSKDLVLTQEKIEHFRALLA